MLNASATGTMTLRPIDAIPRSENLIVYEVSSNGKPLANLYFKALTGETLVPRSDMSVPLLLLPAMKAGRDIGISGSVSARLVDNAEKIQDILCSWNPGLNKIKINASATASAVSNGADRVGAFFSGGVDSFYTLLKNIDDITDIIFIHGFDIRLSNHSLREKTRENLRHIAASYGKGLVEIETNLRALYQSFGIGWGPAGHGAALATVGHALGQTFRRLYISSTRSYANMAPWGSHLILDPLWSSETLEFVHDGCEANRQRKVAFISRSDVALKNLRVCYQNEEGRYNCGRCEKCVRTMINLKMAGALGRCTTFKNDLDPARVRALRVDQKNVLVLLREILGQMEVSSVEKELQKALKSVIRRAALRAFGRSTRAVVGGTPLLSDCLRFARKLLPKNGPQTVNEKEKIILSELNRSPE